MMSNSQSQSKLTPHQRVTLEWPELRGMHRDVRDFGKESGRKNDKSRRSQQVAQRRGTGPPQIL